MTILFSDMISGEECFSDTLEIFDGNLNVFISLCCEELKNINVMVG